MLAPFILYLLTINALAYGAFARDKRLAVQGGRRMPERTLLLIAAMGGAPGALLARRMLRHKTRKQPFGIRLWLIAGLQAAAVAAAWVWFR